MYCERVCALLERQERRGREKRRGGTEEGREVKGSEGEERALCIFTCVCVVRVCVC